MKHGTRVLAKGVAALALASTAHAADCPAGYPDGPIKMQVGYSAGGGTDTVARKVAAMLEETSGWTSSSKTSPVPPAA